MQYVCRCLPIYINMLMYADVLAHRHLYTCAHATAVIFFVTKIDTLTVDSLAFEGCASEQRHPLPSGRIKRSQHLWQYDLMKWLGEEKRFSSCVSCSGFLMWQTIRPRQTIANPVKVPPFNHIPAICAMMFMLAFRIRSHLRL